MYNVTIDGRVFKRVSTSGVHICECRLRGLCAFHEDSNVIDYECVCNNDINCSVDGVDYIYLEEK